MVWLALSAGCGDAEPGFRIDNVSLAPDDFPMHTTSSEDLKISVSVFNDRQEVLEVLVRCDEAPIWIDLEAGRYPRWSAEVPIADFASYAVGDYWLDFEARDTADRLVRLEDAVRFRITEH